MEQNLSLYNIFYETAKCGNISKAARSLFISQPAVSKSIRTLENNLNVRLFNRTPRGVSLTEEGETLYKYIDSAFLSINEGESELLRATSLGIGHLKIGVSTTLCKYVLLPYLQAFIKENPHIQISILNQSSSHTLSLLEQREIDVGLIAEPQNKKGITFMPLKEIFDCFVATDSYIKNLMLREGTDSINSNINLFKNATVMMLDTSNVTRNHMDLYLQNAGITPSHILEVSTMGLIIDFAKIGLGIGCVIKDFVRDELDSNILKEIQIPCAVSGRQIGFIWRAENEVSRSMKKFIDFVYNA